MKWLFALGRRNTGAPTPPTPAQRDAIARQRETNAHAAAADVGADLYAAQVDDSRAWTRWALHCCALVLGAFLLWAALAELDEVTSGNGKIIPTSREQVVQSLESGIVAEILVREGETVDAGQPLLRIDDVRLGSTVKESQSKIDALTLAATRLRAEAQNHDFAAPEDIARRNPSLAHSERQTFAARRRSLETSLAAQGQSLKLAQEELRITEPLAARGLVSELEVMRVQRAIVEHRGRIAELSGKFRADAAAELTRVEAELGAQSAAIVGRQDSLKRTVLTAPKRGIVKNVRVTTVGGVVQSGQDLLEIVPLDDTLLVETRIRPADIAFLRPGLPAIVKISAYDASIYGWLEGELLQISADSLRDEVRREETYYRALVRTRNAALRTADGKHLPIIPGMQAQVDIRTGKKSVLSYLFKPVFKAREALRER